MVQLLICTRHGMRVEFLRPDRVERARRDEQAELKGWSAVLTPTNGFQDGRVRLGLWGVPRSSATEIGKARFMGPPGWQVKEEENYEADEAPTEVEEEVPMLGRKRVLQPPVIMARSFSGGFLEICLTDGERELSDVAYVWVVPLSASSCCWNAHGALANSLPHPFHSFRIENTCGACMLSVDAPLDLDRFRVAGSDQIVLLGGTLAERLNGREVDFRGVRGVMRLLHELSELTRVPRAAVRVTVYMVVMKGCVGTPTMVVDYGMRPPATLGGAAATLAEEGFRRCYLAERMAPWCEGYAQHVEVCQVWVFLV